MDISLWLTNFFYIFPFTCQFSRFLHKHAKHWNIFGASWHCYIFYAIKFFEKLDISWKILWRLHWHSKTGKNLAYFCFRRGKNWNFLPKIFPWKIDSFIKDVMFSKQKSSCLYWVIWKCEKTWVSFAVWEKTGFVNIRCAIFSHYESRCTDKAE